MLHPPAREEEPRKGKARKATEATATSEPTAEQPPPVSLAERAWIAALFQLGKPLDAAGVWARHLGRLSEPPQGTLPGVSGPPVQLLMLGGGSAPPAELATLDEARLLLVLDDLVASGDLQVGGRGKKKRFQLVPRGVSS